MKTHAVGIERHNPEKKIPLLRQHDAIPAFNESNEMPPLGDTTSEENCAMAMRSLDDATRTHSRSLDLAIITRWELRRSREKDDDYQSRMDDPTEEVQAAMVRENERFCVDAQDDA